MAKTCPKLQSTIFIIMLFLSATMFIPCTNSQPFSRILSKEKMGLKREKLTHLHFYFHEIFGGKHPTAVQVAEAAVTNTSKTGFGLVKIIDNPLTEGPNLSSKLVGRAQGIAAHAAIENVGLLMVVNCVFLEGIYNGSTLSVLGRNEVLLNVKELPILGGSGVFRFARGYAKARTHAIDLTDAIIEFDVYVLHHY